MPLRPAAHAFCRRALGSVLLLACACGLGAQPLPPALQARVDVAYLSSDLLGGRAAGSPFADSAAAYVAARMASIGLAPAGTDGGYLQPFGLRVPGHGQGGGEAPPLSTSNVLGTLDRGAAHTLVIGAHYDHLGFGGEGSLHVGEPKPHNGADDNASGVAVMLALAARLVQDSAGQLNVLFVAFSGEERGLLGSKHLVEHWPESLAPAAVMLNLDMVGRLSPDSVLAVNGTGTSPRWDTLLARVAAGRVQLRSHASGLGPSDHASFYLDGVPVLHFFTGQHAQYHKPGDDANLVNFAGMATVGALIYDLVAALEREGAPAFAKTEDAGAVAAASDFRVTLGIMPDYVYAGVGLRVDAVLDDRPAQAAGIERGDVILRLGGREIGDIYDYMEALGTYEPGASPDVVIGRGEQRLRKRVTF